MKHSQYMILLFLSTMNTVVDAFNNNVLVSINCCFPSESFSLHTLQYKSKAVHKYYTYKKVTHFHEKERHIQKS